MTDEQRIQQMKDEAEIAMVKRQRLNELYRKILVVHGIEVPAKKDLIACIDIHFNLKA